MVKQKKLEKKARQKEDHGREKVQKEKSRALHWIEKEKASGRVSGEGGKIYRCYIKNEVARMFQVTFLQQGGETRSGTMVSGKRKVKAALAAAAIFIDVLVDTIGGSLLYSATG